MIPEIGVMVGFYILTRMTEVFLTEDMGSAFRAVPLKLLALVTIIVTLVVTADLALRGSVGLNLGDLQ